MGTIDSIFLAAIDGDDGIMYEPPKVKVEVLIIAGVLTIQGWPGERPNSERGGEPLFSVDLAARSVLVALKALIKDDEAALPKAVLMAEDAMATVAQSRHEGRLPPAPLL